MPEPVTQEPEIQEPRVQEAGVKETEIQEPVAQEPRIQEPRAKETETQEPRVQEPGAKEIEIQEPIAQEPGDQEPRVQELGTKELETPAQRAVEEIIRPEEVQETQAPPLPLETLDAPIRRLLDIGAVHGAFICSKDGLLIQDYCENRRDVEEMSALIAAIFNEAEQSSQFLKAGNVEKFIIEKGDETICVLVTVESLFTVITEPEARPGLVFVYARKIIDEIKEILG
jgi:predicted regulator of Ras-like GTPase activity (Roadblock/LC7/MglB family)